MFLRIISLISNQLHRILPLGVTCIKTIFRYEPNMKVNNEGETYLKKVKMLHIKEIREKKSRKKQSKFVDSSAMGHCYN